MNEYKRKGMVHGRIRASRRWRAFAALPLLYTKIIIKKKNVCWPTYEHWPIETKLRLLCLK